MEAVFYQASANYTGEDEVAYQVERADRPALSITVKINVAAQPKSVGPPRRARTFSVVAPSGSLSVAISNAPVPVWLEPGLGLEPCPRLAFAAIKMQRQR